MKTFFVIRNKDSADEFVSALLSAGYQEVGKLERADFLLIDGEHDGGKKERIFKFARRKPTFIYPHTPYSYFIWDGLYEPAPVACNFVVGDGAVIGMKAYGYPYRVEKIGWTGCSITGFMPTSGTRLLFAPPHPLGNGKYPRPEQYDLVKNAAKFIAKNLSVFKRVVVSCTPHGIIESGLDDLVDHRVEWDAFEAYRSRYPRKHALSMIREADIVISSGTLGYISVARGKPTVMIGYRDNEPGTISGVVEHYDLYKSHFAYPLTIEAMTIEEVLDARKSDDKIREWKRLNIGKVFDKEKFIKIVRGYV